MLLTAPGGVKAPFWRSQDDAGQEMTPPLASRVDVRGRPLLATITARGAPKPCLSQNVMVIVEPEAMPFGW